MGFWDWFRSVFARHVGGTDCPRCGFSYLWDGRRCGHCNFPGQRRYAGPPDRVRGLPQHGQHGQPGQPGPPVAQPLPTATPIHPGPPGLHSQPIRVVPVEGLDAAQFAPMSADQARQAIAGFGQSWRSAYLDSTRVIPDVRLPRVQLIDRAMVGLGLITPEELANIHEIGRQMGLRRGDWQQAVAVAEQAIARSQEERQRIKQQKRAEAEARRRKRAEEVAHRRASDIVFLGRGVSAGLADRRANVEKLQAAGLPVLATPADLAGAIGISVPRLRWLAWHSEAAPTTHYVRFTVPKKSGGTRTLSAPHALTKTVQSWVLQNILGKVAVHPAAHGFVPGRSTVTNASAHVGRRLVVNCDLTDFFPTITFARVKGLIAQLGYSPAVAVILALLCTESPRRQVNYAGRVLHVATGLRALPQGAPSSPALSNLVSRRMDSRLAGLAGKLGWTYSRYADDLSFSTDQTDAKVAYLLACVRHIAGDEGFAVNERKTRVLRPQARQEVTGVVVNKRPGVPRRLVRRVRAILNNARHDGLAAQARRGQTNIERWLEGTIAYIHMVNPAQAAPLRQAFAQLRNDQ